MRSVNITINGAKYCVPEGITILEAAQRNGIRIPTLCRYEGLAPKANCRICIVEVDGSKKYKLSCAVKVSEGMTINTDTPDIISERKSTLERMFEFHSVDCHHCLRIGSSKCDDLDPKFCESCFFCDCVRDGFCELQTLAREYKVDRLPFEIKPDSYEVDDSLGSIIRNPNKCIKCRRCVDICTNVQTACALDVTRLGGVPFIGPAGAKTLKESPCVRCGRCVDVCPTGGVFMREHKDELIYFAHSYGITTVAQVSPGILSELESLFKMASGRLTIELVTAGLRKIGVDYVVTDDFALSCTQLFAEKLLDDRLEWAERPLIVTDSFAAKNFLEINFPDITKNLLFFDSVQQFFGQYAKIEFAKKIGVAPENIRTFSITNDNDNGAEAHELKSVDISLNARELYRIFMRTGVNPAKRRPSDPDVLGAAGVSSRYGKLLGRVDWLLSGDIEELEFRAGGKLIKAAIAPNLGRARELLEHIRDGEAPYTVIRIVS